MRGTLQGMQEVMAGLLPRIAPFDAPSPGQVSSFCSKGRHRRLESKELPSKVPHPIMCIAIRKRVLRRRPLSRCKLARESAVSKASGWAAGAPVRGR